MRAMSRNLLFWILWVAFLVGAAIWLGFATHWNPDGMDYIGYDFIVTGSCQFVSVF